MRCLTLCPTRARPDRIRRMLETFYANKSPDTDIVFYVSDDDPRLPEYVAYLPNDKLTIGPRVDINQAFNRMFRDNPDVPYYSITNDDYVYLTENWDAHLIRAIETRCGFWGIANSDSVLTRDNYPEHRHPAGCVISGNIPRTLGYIYHPILNSYRNDTALRDLAEGLGPNPDSHYVYLPDVVIEHEHFSNGRASHDPTYATQYDDAHKRRGDALYADWFKTFRHDDVRKLQNAMMQDAYKRGFDACYYNQSQISDNPFLAGDQYDTWIAGYRQSNMERE